MDFSFSLLILPINSELAIISVIFQHSENKFNLFNLLNLFKFPTFYAITGFQFFFCM